MTQIKIEASIDATNQKHVNAAIEFLRLVSDQESIVVPMSFDGEKLAEKLVVKDEKPAKEEKAKKPAKEEKAEKPAKEEKAEKPAKEEKAEKPAKESSIKIDEVRAALSKKVGEHRAEIKNMLTELGAANVTSLKQEDYQQFYDFLNDL